MTSTDILVEDFFLTYPYACKMYVVAGQSFHANAFEAAKLRAAFFDAEIETYKNAKNPNCDGDGSGGGGGGSGGGTNTEGYITEKELADNVEIMTAVIENILKIPKT